MIHMVTAAEGAQDHFARNDVRHESVEGAQELDAKIQKCYKNHSDRYIITNEFIVKDFDVKKLVLLTQVYQVLLKLIQEKNITEYYQEYIMSMRKGSDDDIPSEISPYMVRKLKYKRFMKRESSPLKK